MVWYSLELRHRYEPMLRECEFQVDNLSNSLDRTTTY